MLLITVSIYADLLLWSLAVVSKSTIKVSTISSPNLTRTPTSVSVGAYSNCSSRAIPSNASEGVSAPNADGVAIATSIPLPQLPGFLANILSFVSKLFLKFDFLNN